MFDRFRKKRLNKMSETDCGVIEKDWVQRFTALNSEAIEYADRFILATNEIVDLWREIDSTDSYLLILKDDTYGVAWDQLKEEAQTALSKMGEENEKNRELLWQKRKGGLSEATEALEKLPPILGAIEQLPTLKSETAQSARNFHQLGLEFSVEACETYIRWCECEDYIRWCEGLSHIIGKATIGEATSKIADYRLYCGRWDISGNKLSIDLIKAFKQGSGCKLFTEMIESLK